MLCLGVVKMGEQGLYLSPGRGVISSFIPRYRRHSDGTLDLLKECCSCVIGCI